MINDPVVFNAAYDKFMKGYSTTFQNEYCKNIKTKYQSNKLWDLKSDFFPSFQIIMSWHCPNNVEESLKREPRNYTTRYFNLTPISSFNKVTRENDYFCNFFKFWNSTTQNDSNI